MSEANTNCVELHLIHQAIIWESISKLKNGKAAGPSELVSEMVTSAGEAEIDMITSLTNQIIVEGIISTGR